MPARRTPKRGWGPSPPDGQTKDRGATFLESGGGGGRASQERGKQPATSVPYAHRRVAAVLSRRGDKVGEAAYEYAAATRRACQHVVCVYDHGAAGDVIPFKYAWTLRYRPLGSWARKVDLPPGGMVTCAPQHLVPGMRHDRHSPMGLCADTHKDVSTRSPSCQDRRAAACQAGASLTRYGARQTLLPRHGAQSELKGALRQRPRPSDGIPLLRLLRRLACGTLPSSWLTMTRRSQPRPRPPARRTTACRARVTVATGGPLTMPPAQKARSMPTRTTARLASPEPSFSSSTR